MFKTSMAHKVTQKIKIQKRGYFRPKSSCFTSQKLRSSNVHNPYA